jgi:hypothetical protein
VELDYLFNEVKEHCQETDTTSNDAGKATATGTLSTDSSSGSCSTAASVQPEAAADSGVPAANNAAAAAAAPAAEGSDEDVRAIAAQEPDSEPVNMYSRCVRYHTKSL